jgi:pyruvate kinase
MKTKIIATIGPASRNKISQLCKAGMYIGRINTKYGKDKQYDEIISSLRKTKCKIMFDIKGREMISWLKRKDFDYIAVSFAQTAKQIKEIRKEFSPRRVRIISKIENRNGFNNLAELIRESDGIMVARGDLGRHVPFEEVPILQKLIIRRCNKKDTMVITATEMLLSMVKSKIPERAEVSDVANAILDGSDGVMLSEETTIGKYPVLAVKTMAKVILCTEKNMKRLSVCDR